MAAAVLAASLSGCSSEAQVNSQTKYDGEKALVLSDSKITLDGKAVGANGEVYTSNDVIYYEDKDVYESGNPYGEGTDSDKHTAEEAASVTVVNITEAGIYRLSGKMSNGQIRVDLGEDAAEDETAVVTLVLDGLDIKCDVAPAVVFMNVYECDGDWSLETAQMNVDTSKAGANVIVADGSVNNIEGAYVAKIFKDK
ncbi:MAG: carbohydrate-binding domain-containing protein, partial [Oscillospiraceae bacterium]|nr:carbohydrate-binding domain-containing protein [Oscillospiraceae bacterium]